MIQEEQNRSRGFRVFFRFVFSLSILFYVCILIAFATLYEKHTNEYYWDGVVVSVLGFSFSLYAWYVAWCAHVFPTKKEMVFLFLYVSLGGIVAIMLFTKTNQASIPMGLFITATAFYVTFKFVNWCFFSSKTQPELKTEKEEEEHIVSSMVSSIMELNDEDKKD